MPKRGVLGNTHIGCFWAYEIGPLYSWCNNEVFSTYFLGSGRERVHWGKEVARIPIV